jgi:hypothetical protein
MAISVGLYGCYTLFQRIDLGSWPDRGFALVLLSLFGLLIINVERKEFQRLPYVGRFFTTKTVKA